MISERTFVQCTQSILALSAGLMFAILPSICNCSLLLTLNSIINVSSIKKKPIKECIFGTKILKYNAFKSTNINQYK